MSGIEEGKGKLERARGYYADGITKLQEGHEHFGEKNEFAPRQREVKTASLEAARTALNSVLDTRGTLETLMGLFKEGENISKEMERRACQAEDSFTEAEILARKASELVDEPERTTPPIEGAYLLKEAAATSVLTSDKAGSFCFSSHQSAAEIDRGLAEIAKILTNIVDQIPFHDHVTPRHRQEMPYPVDATSAFNDAVATIDQRLDTL